MYKLILGNVRITVADDGINQSQAAAAARKAINEATLMGKLLSHIEVVSGANGLEAIPTEKEGCRSSHKTLKQSMLDGMVTAMKEKLYPANAYTAKDSWFDGETGQEWRGTAVNDARDEIMKAFEGWAQSVK
jgi:hypothetical protein